MPITTADTVRHPRRQRRAAAAPVPDLEYVDRTHREIVEVLAKMEQLADLLSQPGQQERAALLAGEACRFFHGPAWHHHEAEETRVFPALLAGHDPAVREEVQRLQQDHHWLEEDWLELEPHLRAVVGGYGPEHLDFLRPALTEFTSLYREHLSAEEALLHR